MKELTDLEIKVEIAKIHLGHKYDIHKKDNGYVGYIPADCVGRLTEFDPFDDALCSNLADDFKISVIYDDGAWWALPEVSHWAAGGSNGRFDFECDFAIHGYDKNRAILLAIIETEKCKQKTK